MKKHGDLLSKQITVLAAVFGHSRFAAMVSASSFDTQAPGTTGAGRRYACHFERISAFISETENGAVLHPSQR